MRRDVCRDRIPQDDPEEQTTPPDLADRPLGGGEIGEADAELRCTRRDVRQDILCLDHVEYCERRRCRDRIPAERRRVLARPEHLGSWTARDAGPDGHAVPQRLRERDDVGGDGGLLEGEPRSGPADARLDLVDHQQSPVFVAGRARRGKHLRRERTYPALALDDLEEHGTGVRTHGRRECRRVVVWDRVDEPRERLERHVLGGLAGGLEGRESATMETALQRDDADLAVVLGLTVAACELDRSLVRRRAALREEDPSVRPAGESDQTLRKFEGRDREEEVRGVHEPTGLLRDRGSHRRMCMPDSGDGDAAQEIEPLLTVHVSEPRPLSGDEDHLGLWIGPHEPSLRDVQPLLATPCRSGGRWSGSHECTSGAWLVPDGPPTIVPIPSSVKISMSTACCTRPSRMCA